MNNEKKKEAAESGKGSGAQAYGDGAENGHRETVNI